MSDTKSSDDAVPSSFWDDVPMAPTDPILGVTEGYNKVRDQMPHLPLLHLFPLSSPLLPPIPLLDFTAL